MASGEMRALGSDAIIAAPSASSSSASSTSRPRLRLLVFHPTGTFRASYLVQTFSRLCPLLPSNINNPGLGYGGFETLARVSSPAHLSSSCLTILFQGVSLEEEHIRQLQEDGCYTNPIRDLLYALRYKKHDVQATMLFLQSRMSPAEIDAIEERQINRRRLCRG